MNIAETVIAYHDRTKHQLYRYAAGPETLDWTAQPNPFREFSGAPRITLPLSTDTLDTTFAQLYAPPGIVPPQPFSIDSLGALLELSFGLSAWKEYGPDRWALRCNPSSGNLHPTEAYLISHHVPNLANGVYHYVSRDHVLEQREHSIEIAHGETDARVWIGLTSIQWREAWKYGERAFRYCQLDTGHALGALHYAARALGWRAQVVSACGTHSLATLLGLNRANDFNAAEREDPEVLVALYPDTTPAIDVANSRDILPQKNIRGVWHGRANVLDPHPMYRWPVIDQVTSATERDATIAEPVHPTVIPLLIHRCTQSAARVIRSRRSAQHFDGKHTMAAQDFFHLLDCTLPRAHSPWELCNHAARIHPVIFVHCVDGVPPGIYVLTRNDAVQTALRTAMKSDFTWMRVEHCPDHLPLFQLAAGDRSKIARTLHCNQAIAANGCFALGMLAEFDDVVRDAPWRYRQLHWEAGLLGHMLYLEAEAMGLRGTGIGCYFDDAFHELLGLRDKKFQSLYHFTVGRALVDERITTLPPYPNRAAHTLEKVS